MQQSGGLKMNNLLAKAKTEFKGGLLSRYGYIVILIVILALFSVLSPRFFTVNNLMNIGLQASIRGILAVGMTIIIISGGIDLSVGMIMSLASIVLGYTVITLKLGMPLGILSALVTGVVCGAFNGLLITKGKLPPFIATLGLTGIAGGFALVISAGYSMYGFPDSFTAIAANTFLGLPIPLILLLIIGVIYYFFLYSTHAGRYCFAIGSNEEAAKLSGINVTRKKMLFYSNMGLLAGFASIILTSRIASAHPAAGAGYELDAIAASVIGGASLMGGEGSIPGAVVGAIIMATIQNGLNVLDVNPFWQKVAIGFILIIAVLMDQLRKGRDRK
jgi:ribose/xylose/arabinose/galactoside ABC-type transport system permease subunit